MTWTEHSGACRVYQDGADAPHYAGGVADATVVDGTVYCTLPSINTDVMALPTHVFERLHRYAMAGEFDFCIGGVRVYAATHDEIVLSVNGTVVLRRRPRTFREIVRYWNESAEGG